MSFEPVIADPESDPAATWALEPALVRRLARHVVADPGAPRRATTAPFTGAPVASLPTSTPADVEVAIARARAVQPSWAARSIADRAAVLLRLHDLLLQRQGEILDIIQTESGKARLHAYEEVVDVAINCRWLARRGPGLLRAARRAGVVPAHAGAGAPPPEGVGIIVPGTTRCAVDSMRCPRCSWQRRRDQARRPDPLTALCRAEIRCARPGRTGCSASSSGNGRRRGRWTPSTMSASPIHRDRWIVLSGRPPGGRGALEARRKNSPPSRPTPTCQRPRPRSGLSTSAGSCACRWTSARTDRDPFLPVRRRVGGCGWGPRDFSTDLGCWSRATQLAGRLRGRAARGARVLVGARPRHRAATSRPCSTGYR